LEFLGLDQHLHYGIMLELWAVFDQPGLAADTSQVCAPAQLASEDVVVGSLALTI
jgi:hypothetical protein